MKAVKIFIFLVMFLFLFSFPVLSQDSDRVETNTDEVDDDENDDTRDRPRMNRTRLSNFLNSSRAMHVRDRLKVRNLDEDEEVDYKCHEDDEIRDRVRCRIKLAKATLTAVQRADFKLDYIPSDCRINDDQTERQNCVQRYAHVQKMLETRRR